MKRVIFELFLRYLETDELIRSGQVSQLMLSQYEKRFDFGQDQCPPILSGGEQIDAWLDYLNEGIEYSRSNNTKRRALFFKWKFINNKLKHSRELLDVKQEAQCFFVRHSILKV